LTKTKAEKEQLLILEKSLDKNRAITMYNDMQMYVDQTMTDYYQRITTDVSLL